MGKRAPEYLVPPSNRCLSQEEPSGEELSGLELSGRELSGGELDLLILPHVILHDLEGLVGRGALPEKHRHHGSVEERSGKRKLHLFHGLMER